MNDARFGKIDMQRVDQPMHVFETEFDPEALQTVEPGERFFV